MTREQQLFEILGEIDDEILERSESVKKVRLPWKELIVAASVCLIIGATVKYIGLINNRNNLPNPTNPIESDYQIPTTTEEPSETKVMENDAFEVHYNLQTSVLSGDRLHIAGYFTEELSEMKLLEVIPTGSQNFLEYEYTGKAGFDGNGNLLQVFVDVCHIKTGSVVSVAISEGVEIIDSNDTNKDIEKSLYKDIEYEVYELKADDRVSLFASAFADGIHYNFSMETSHENLESAKEVFENVLICFTMYDNELGKPMLEGITPTDIPEWKDDKISLEEAKADKDFGAYMLTELPGGFKEESIRRYIDQNFNYLSGLWTRGYDELRWRVSFFGEEDMARITSVEDINNYDLNLYPIPRAESVPEALREIVDNPIFKIEELTLDAVYKRAYKINDAGDSEGYRMQFSVLVGDVVIEITSKGVEPEWVYEALKNFY